MNFKGKDCVSHMLQHLAGMDERVDNSRKQKAEYLCFSLIHTERSQCQTCFIWEKSACLVEVVTRPDLWKFPNTQKS